MKTHYPFRPLLVPAVLGAVTAFALLAALLSDGALEMIALVLFASVIGLVAVKLLLRRKKI